MYNTAPHLARDPVAAGAFIKQNLSAQYLDDYGGPPLDTYRSLSSVEKDILSNRESGSPEIMGYLAGGLTGGLLG